jgi:hypothetical protein
MLCGIAQGCPSSQLYAQINISAPTISIGKAEILCNVSMTVKAATTADRD